MTNGEYVKELLRLSPGSGEGDTLADFIALLEEVDTLSIKRRKIIMTKVADVLKEETSY